MPDGRQHQATTAGPILDGHDIPWESGGEAFPLKGGRLHRVSFDQHPGRLYAARGMQQPKAAGESPPVPRFPPVFHRFIHKGYQVSSSLREGAYRM